MVVTWLAYTLVVWLALWHVRRYRVRGGASIFLVGAGVGWLVEGAIVPEIYSALPWSLAWTALAWHATLSVLVGWVWLPRALRSSRLGRGLAITTAVGLAWGAWAAAWFGYQGLAPHVAGFAGYALAMTVLLAASYVLQSRLRPSDQSLRGGRGGAAACVALALWFALNVLPAWPPAPLVLLPLLALVVIGSARRTPEVDTPDAIAAGDFGVRPGRVGLLAAFPAAAAATYAALGPLPSAWFEGIVAGLVLVSLVVLGWALLPAGSGQWRDGDR